MGEALELGPDDHLGEIGDDLPGDLLDHLPGDLHQLLVGEAGDHQAGGLGEGGRGAIGQALRDLGHRGIGRGPGRRCLGRRREVIFDVDGSDAGPLRRGRGQRVRQRPDIDVRPGASTIGRGRGLQGGAADRAGAIVVDQLRVLDLFGLLEDQIGARLGERLGGPAEAGQGRRGGAENGGGGDRGGGAGGGGAGVGGAAKGRATPERSVDGLRAGAANGELIGAFGGTKGGIGAAATGGAGGGAGGGANAGTTGLGAGGGVDGGGSLRFAKVAAKDKGTSLSAPRPIVSRTKLISAWLSKGFLMCALAPRPRASS